MKKLLQKLKSQSILLAIIILAVVLRFFSLADLPPSPTWDEVAWGYNAYALGQDLRDEFGEFVPVTYLESFGDFKPPLYAYISIIPVKLFGMTVFATRFASAFFGVLTVLLTFYLVRMVLGDKNSISLLGTKISIALLSAFLLAISPWHILLSRAAFEANVSTFFIGLGVFLFLKSADTDKKWLFVFSIVSFVLSMYTFNTARIVAPILVIVLTLFKRKELFKMKKQFFSGALIGLVMFLPLLFFLQTPQAQLRFQEVNIFSDISVIERVNEQVVRDDNAFWSKIIHNRRLAYGVEYVKHYFDNLSPSFLFIKGDGNPKFSVQDVGQMYIWEIPFFILGILYLIRKKEKNWWILPLWLIIGILPAASARETPHALRIESSLPTFQIFTAYGVVHLLNNLSGAVKRIKLKWVLLIGFAAVVFFNFVYFIHNYTTHYSRIYSGEWQYGYEEAIEYTESVKNEYEDIYFTTELGRPYAYVLFYGGYEPEYIRQSSSVERDAFGFVKVMVLGKYTFHENIGTFSGVNSLFIDVPANVPDGANIVKEFYLLNGNTALVAYTK